MAHQSHYIAPSAAASCPAPMTRAALLALRAANQLSTDCLYTITDHVQNRLVAGTQIMLHAVAANRLSEDVHVLTTYDNEAWSGIYDIDRGLVLELTDNRGNRAKGFNGTEVANFDWGNTAWTNVVVDSATLTVTYGNAASLANLVIRQNATVSITGFTGQLNNLLVENFGQLTATNANGTWRMGRISDNSVFNMTNYTGGGDNWYFEILHGSNVNISNRASSVTLRTSSLYAMTVNASGAVTSQLTIQNCPTLMNSTIIQAVGAGPLNITRVALDGLSQINAATGGGTLTIGNSRVESGSTVRKTNGGSLNVNQCTFVENSVIYNDGSGAMSLTRCNTKTLGQIGAQAGSVTTFNANDTSVDAQGTVLLLGATTAGTLTVAASRIASTSFLYKRAAHTGAITISQCELLGASGLDFVSGNRSYNCTRVDMNEVSRASFTGTGAVTDTISELFMETRSSLTISCSGAANTILYSLIRGLSGAISLTGTTGAQTVNRCQMLEGSLAINNCTANLNTTFLTALNNGRYSFQNMTVAKVVQYCNVENNSIMTFNGATGGGTVRYVNVRNAAQFTQSGPAASAAECDIWGGVLNQNGGSINNVAKGGGGTLTTGNFNHANVNFFDSGSFVMTAANNARARYTGLAAGAYTGTGNVI